MDPYSVDRAPARLRQAALGPGHVRPNGQADHLQEFRRSAPHQAQKLITDARLVRHEEVLAYRDWQRTREE